LDVTIRSANTDEADTLTSIALASKAIWGYDDNFMSQCRDELTITKEYIQLSEVYIAEFAEQVVGFYGLTVNKPHGVLDFLYVSPDLLKQGIGRKLWDHLLKMAKSLGIQSISIDAEPNAENFYRSMGAKRIGTTPSGSIQGRVLPLMRGIL